MRVTIRIAATTKEQLLDRLDSITELVQRGSTPGERASAEAARQRVIERLEREFGFAPNKQPKQGPQQPGRNKFCDQCGTKTPAGFSDRFCQQCGHEIGTVKAGRN